MKKQFNFKVSFIFLISFLLILCSCAESGENTPNIENEITVSTTHSDAYYENNIDYNIPDSELPVRDDSALWPAYSLAELTENVEYIYYAKVICVGEPFLSSYNRAYTPVELSIIKTLKGEENETFTFIRDGGRVRNDYIQKSSTFQLTDGMEAVYFLNKQGYTCGYIGVWPVAEDMVAINWDSFKILDGVYDIEMKYVNLSEHPIADLFEKTESHRTCNLDDFLTLIESLVKNND
jgi:hypothetical protein